MIISGVGHIDLAKSENKNLEEATNVLVAMLEEVVKEERTRSRKVGRKSILKTPVRRTKHSDVIPSKTLTLSASALNNTALAGSGHSG